jgi:hypothetical protein
MGGATGQSSGSYGGLGAVMNGISNPVGYSGDFMATKAEHLVET